jgi:hypothetical protein
MAHLPAFRLACLWLAVLAMLQPCKADSPSQEDRQSPIRAMREGRAAWGLSPHPYMRTGASHYPIAVLKQPSSRRMTGPTAWAAPPASYSYSSLTAIDRCPRQWQLLHSPYGSLDRFPTRPHPAAVEGDIVHTVLDRLFRSLALQGMPPQGTAAFKEAVGAVDIHNSVRRLVGEHEGLVALHPRGGGFRLRVGPQQLANRVVRLFRELYPEAVATYRGTAPRGYDMGALLFSRSRTPTGCKSQMACGCNWPAGAPNGHQSPTHEVGKQRKNDGWRPLRPEGGRGRLLDCRHDQAGKVARCGRLRRMPGDGRGNSVNRGVPPLFLSRLFPADP